MTTHFSIKVTDKQASYLENLALKERLFKSNGTPSLGKATKKLLDNIINSAELKEQKPVDLKKTNELLEQINVLIPQLIFNGIFSAKAESQRLDDVNYQKIFAATIEKTAAVCGHIQQQTYEHLYVAIDSKNMKTIPIEPGENVWK